MGLKSHSETIICQHSLLVFPQKQVKSLPCKVEAKNKQHEAQNWPCGFVAHLYSGWPWFALINEGVETPKCFVKICI